MRGRRLSSSMSAELLADLAHLFFLESAQAQTDREARYLLKCSRALAARAIKEGKRNG